MGFSSQACPESVNYLYLVEKQLQYPAQVLVLWARCEFGVHLSEVGIQKCNNAHQQPLILNTGWTHLKKPTGMKRQRPCQQAGEREVGKEHTIT